MLRSSFTSLVILLCLSILDGQALILSGKGYDMHAELNWNSISTADRYQIWRKAEDDPGYSVLTETRKLRLQDWTGRDLQEDFSYQYYIDALSVTGVVLETSDTIDAVVAPSSDDQFLDMVQEYTFRYFYEYGHPTSGMVRERLGSDDIVTTCLLYTSRCV